jgi:hypothetical protein
MLLELPFPRIYFTPAREERSDEPLRAAEGGTVRRRSRPLRDFLVRR